MRRTWVVVVLFMLWANVQGNSKKESGGTGEGTKEGLPKGLGHDDETVVVYSVSKKLYFYPGKEEPMFEIQVAKISTVDPSKRGSKPEDKSGPRAKQDSVTRSEVSVQDICKILKKINPMLLPTSPLDFLSAHEFTFANKTRGKTGKTDEL